MEWVLQTPWTKTFQQTVVHRNVITKSEPVVDDAGNPSSVVVEEEHVEEVQVQVQLLADRVRVASAANDASAKLFHIRLIYGRLDDNGQFDPAVRDDGIVIGGPNYDALDTDEDGLISEAELLSMSAQLLGWDGELRRDLPVEGLA